ncbi:MAG: site-2 protease family protein [Thaumarchaeota archaeon]|nr:site-2 protease family protein [Nitrososphaerota archaeon]
MSAINTEVDSAVRSLFSVNDYFVAEEGAAEYSVAFDNRSSSNFLKLLKLLKRPGYSAQLYGDPEHATLLVTKNPPLPERRPQVLKLSAPVFLFFLTLLSTFVTGYVVAVIFPDIAPNSSPLEMGAGFEAGLLAVLVSRELVHRYIEGKGSFSSVSYFLPNVPLFVPIPTMYFLPTFGSVSFPSTPSANRNKLFDFYFLGSLVAVAVAAVVAFLGAGTSVVLSQSDYAALLAGNQTATIQTNPSIIQTAALSLAQSVGLSPAVPPGGTLIFSPIEIAAWLGLLLAFFNLMPAGLFDGGRMARLVLGDKGSRATTMVTGALLLVVDLPNYWVIFVLLFLMASFPVQGETLDSISGLSSSRKAVFVVAIVVGLLCVPSPQTFATLPA